MATGTLRQRTIVGDNSSQADFQSWAGDISPWITGTGQYGVGNIVSYSGTNYICTVAVTNSSTAPPSDTGHWTATANLGTGISAALNALGFTKTTDQYNANFAGPVPTSTSASLIGATCFPAMSSNARTALAGSNFNLGTAGASAWVSGQSYTAGQVVTYGGYTWICYLATSSTSNPIALTTSWSPYYMEIWEMVASGLSTVYIKLEYGCGSTIADPMFTIQFGTAYVANSGVISGNVTQTEQCLKDSAAATSTECDWASDGQNWLSMYMWRGNATQSGALFFERGISGQTSGAPVYSTTNQYITYLIGFVGPIWHQCSLFLGVVGTVTSKRNAWATVPVIFAAGTQIVNNISPAFPIFPSVGWIGNPMSCVQAYSITDSVEGTTIASTVYGTSTNYLVTINSFVGILGGTASIYGLGLRTA